MASSSDSANPAASTHHSTGTLSRSRKSMPVTYAPIMTTPPQRLDNLEAILGEAGMALANLVRLNVDTTDVDLLFQHYGVLASRSGAAGVAPTTTMLGVTRLAIPGLMVELDGTAVA